MLSVAHTLSGAFVASMLPHPALYLPISLGLHYLGDWTLHWDFGTGLSTGKRAVSTALILEVADLAASAGLVLLLWWLQPSTTSIWSNWHIFVGAAAGLIPDFLEAPRNFLHHEPKWLKPLNYFHNWFHHSTTNMWLGLAPQAVLILLIFGLTVYLR